MILVYHRMMLILELIISDKYKNINGLLYLKRGIVMKFRKYLIIFIFILLSLQAAYAQAEDVIEAGVDAIFEPLLPVIRPIFFKLNILLGGLFGLYVILLITRVYYEYQKLKILKAIRFDLDQANKHIGIRYSTQKNGYIRKLIVYFQERSHDKAVDKLKKIKRRKR
jgi:hypothetical protein